MEPPGVVVVATAVAAVAGSTVEARRRAASPAPAAGQAKDAKAKDAIFPAPVRDLVFSETETCGEASRLRLPRSVEHSGT